jgi:hypothetical protein
LGQLSLPFVWKSYKSRVHLSDLRSDRQDRQEVFQDAADRFNKTFFLNWEAFILIKCTQ